MAETKFDRRSELLRTHTVPMLQETQQSLGNTLGDIVLHTMSPVSQLLMGVTKPLSTPPEQLWIDPQNHLDVNIVLTKPPLHECLKAFTHQTIIRLGMDIEQKVQHERAVAIEQAIAETEQFEQFECSQRVEFAVREEEAKQLLKRERERNDLLTMFQDERDLLIETHTAALEELTQSLTQKCQHETKLRVSEEVARVESECMKLECKWRVEEMVLRVFIDHAQKLQQSAVTEAKNDYFKVFQKLYNSFMMELQDQRDEMYSKHFVELMHVVTVEKTFAADKCDTIRSDLTKQIESLKSKIALLKAYTDPNASPKPCPNRMKIRNILTGFLTQYANFVKWSVKDENEQAEYFIPIQKYMQEMLLEDDHPTGYYECCTSAVHVPEPMPKPDSVDVNEDNDICVKEEDGKGPKEIIFVQACEAKKEVSLPELRREPSVISSSLSCFDFDGMIYASNKHYVKIAERLFPEQAQSPEPEWTKESKEVVLHSESYLNEAELQLQHDVSQVLNTIISDMVDRGLTVELRLTEVLHRHLETILRATHDALHSNVRPPLSAAGIHKQSDLSKLLSVADSVELLGGFTTKVPVQSPIWTDSEADTSALQLPHTLLATAVHTATQCDLLQQRSTTTTTTTSESLEPRRPQHLYVQTDEYLRSLQSVPPYMRNQRTSIARPRSIWDYQVTTDAEWSDLLAKVETMKAVESHTKHVRMVDQSTMIEGRSSTVMQQTGWPQAESFITDDPQSDRQPEQPRKILHVDRRTDGRWNDMNVAKLLHRMEDDADICEWMRSRSMVEEPSELID